MTATTQERRERAAKMRQTVLIRYGRDYWSKIGKRGGVAAREKLGLDFYAKIGKQGGETTLRKHGRAQFREMGHTAQRQKRERKQTATQEARP